MEVREYEERSSRAVATDLDAQRPGSTAVHPEYHKKIVAPAIMINDLR